MGRLDHKVAIITGASSGIGEETARLFAREGASLVLTARRKEKLQTVADEINTAAGGTSLRALAVSGDVSVKEDCVHIVKETIAAFGKIDILVNNAGIADKHLPITRCSDEWWDEVIRIDQTSVFWMTKEALKHMEPAAYGSIVNISSIGGVFGSAGISYSGAKAAVIGMTKNIAIQFAGKGIRCNAICPGPTPTPLSAPEKVKTFDTAFADQCAMHMNMTLPQATVLDQANAILFFASDEAKAVTGQIMIVDNGITL